VIPDAGLTFSDVIVAVVALKDEWVMRRETEVFLACIFLFAVDLQAILAIAFQQRQMPVRRGDVIQGHGVCGRAY
jgi:hypothetical protein